MYPDKPHDKFFKEAFSRTDVTADFLHTYLPDAVRAKLDLSSLRRETDSYTDDQLGEHFADMVFSGAFDGQPVKVTLLLEHKSYTEKHPHFQLNRYILNLWEQQIKEKVTLTPVLPVVIYHGRSSWKKKSIPDYFFPVAPELLSFLPTFDYILIDLTTIETKLTDFRSDYARLTGLLLQYSRRRRDLIRILDDYAQVVRNLSMSAKGQNFVETTFVYLNWASPLTTTEVIAIFHSISNEAGNIAMSAAQKLINEGIEKGLERGLEEGLGRGIRGMLKLGMDVTTIAAAFEMPKEDVEQLIKKINHELK